MSETSEDIIFEDENDGTKRWTNAETKLLITERLKLENDFCSGRRKRNVMWGVVLSNILQIHPEFPYTREQIAKKFANLLATFNRIKKKNKKTGRGATLWIFYELFDEVYGTSLTIEPPENTLIQSLPSAEEISEEEEENRPKRARKHEIYELIKAENERTEARHKELLEIEKKNIELEKAKLQTLMDLKEILKGLLNN